MRHTVLRIGFLSFVSAAFVACGGSSDVSGDNGDDTGGSGSDSSTTDGTGDSSTNDSSTNDSSTSETPGDTTAADGDAPPVCSSEPTRAACMTCCTDEHKEGSKTFDAALLACACTDGICKTECATTACATSPTAPDTACRACLAASLKSPGDAGTDAAGPDGKCNSSVTSACSTDAKCVAYVACVGTCPGG